MVYSSEYFGEKPLEGQKRTIAQGYDYFRDEIKRGKGDTLNLYNCREKRLAWQKAVESTRKEKEERAAPVVERLPIEGLSGLALAARYLRIAHDSLTSANYGSISA
jgi:hypothetical protein